MVMSAGQTAAHANGSYMLSSSVLLYGISLPAEAACLWSFVRVTRPLTGSHLLRTHAVFVVRC